MLNSVTVGSDFVAPEDSCHFVELTPFARHIRPESDADALVENQLPFYLILIQSLHVYLALYRASLEGRSKAAHT